MGDSFSDYHAAHLEYSLGRLCPHLRSGLKPLSLRRLLFHIYNAYKVFSPLGCFCLCRLGNIKYLFPVHLQDITRCKVTADGGPQDIKNTVHQHI